MRRETKAGLVMSVSFIGLVGVVVASKFRDEVDGPPDLRDDAELAALASDLDEPKPVAGAKPDPDKKAESQALTPVSQPPQLAPASYVGAPPTDSVPTMRVADQGADAPRSPVPEPVASTAPAPASSEWVIPPESTPVPAVDTPAVQPLPEPAPAAVEHIEPAVPQTLPEPTATVETPVSPTPPVEPSVPPADPWQPEPAATAPVPMEVPGYSGENAPTAPPPATVDPAPAAVVPPAAVPESAVPAPTEPHTTITGVTSVPEPQPTPSVPAAVLPESTPAIPLPHATPTVTQPTPAPVAPATPGTSVAEPARPAPIVTPPLPVPGTGAQPVNATRVREPQPDGGAAPPPFPADKDPYRVVPEPTPGTGRGPGASLQRPVPPSGPTGGTMPNPASVLPPAGDDAPEGTAVAQGPRPPVGTRPPVGAPPIQVGGPAAPHVEAYDEMTYRAQQGDSFATISKKFYSNDRYAKALLQYNRDHPRGVSSYRQEPPVVQPNQPVFVPPMRILEKEYAASIAGLKPLPAPAPPPLVPGGNPVPPRTPVQGIPTGNPGLLPPQGGSTARPRPAPVQPVAPQPVAPPGRSWSTPTVSKQYRVNQRGEMFRDIAQRTLGNRERWPEIYRLNTRFNPQYPVPANAILRMPGTAQIPPESQP